MHKMNEIEKRFFDAYLKYEEIEENDETCILKPHVQIGIYEVDFVFDRDFVIEVDGHEFHKTKEQRFSDYNRERYLMKNGYKVIRFMGTEVFIDAEKCIADMLEISECFDNKNIEIFHCGLDSGKDIK